MTVDRVADAVTQVAVGGRHDDGRRAMTEPEPRDDAARPTRPVPAARPTTPARPAPATRPTRPARPAPADQDVAGWAGRTMVWLRFVVQLVGVNLLVVLGTLAGGIVLGLLPALGAGGSLLAALASGAPSEHLWREFWSGWRSGFGRMNRLGAPLWFAGLLVAVDLSVLAALRAQGVGGPVTATLTAGLWLVIVYGAVVAAFLVPAARRYDEPVVRTWRFLALAPLLAPGTAIGVLASLVVVTIVLLQVSVLIPLVGLSLPLLATGWLVDQRLDALDAR